MSLSILKKTSIFFFLTLLLHGLTSCSNDLNNPNKEEEKDTTSRRTILVYMVASNSLNGFDNDDIAEMQTAALNGAFNDCRLLIYQQKYESYGTPVLKEIKNGTGKIDTLKVYDNSLSSVSSARMSEVINDAKGFAPAKDYGIVLWSHANGWIVNSSTPDAYRMGDDYAISTRAFGQETINGKSQYMNIPTLAKTLKGKGFSFVYFDCCYMASVEVLYDMRGTTDYIVASPAEVIAEGMPYQLSLPYLFSSGEADLKGAVNAVFNYVDAKRDEDRTATLAVYDMSKIDAVADATKALYSFHPVSPDGFKPQKYQWESTCYFYDFKHIVDNLILPSGTDQTTLSEFEQTKGYLNDALNDLVIYKTATPCIWPGTRQEVQLSNFNGLSSYFVTDSDKVSQTLYDTTSWWNDVAKFQFE